MVAMGHENQRKFSILRCKTSKSLKKSRAARAKDDLLDHQYRDFANDMKSEDLGQMTHSISDFLRRLRAQEYAKNMPMNRPGGLRMWAEAKFLYS